MLRHLVLILFLSVGSTIYSQVSEDTIDQMVDSAWNLMNNVHTVHQAKELALELRAIHENQTSFKAVINAEQLYGESFYLSGQLDSCKRYYLIAQDYALQAKDTNEMAHIDVSLGSLSMDQGDFKNAGIYLDKALAAREILGDTSQATYVLIKQGWMYFTMEDLVLATQKFQKAYDYAVQTNHLSNQGNTLMGLATITKKQGNLKQAESYYKECIEILNQTEDQFGVPAVGVNYGLLLKDMGKADEAIPLFEKSLATYQEYGYEEGKLSCLVNMGICYNRLGEWSTALTHLSKAEPIARNIKENEAFSDVANEQAKAHLNLGNIAIAKNKSTQAVEYAKIGPFPEKLREALKTKSEVFKTAGQDAIALADYEEYTFWKDSLLNETKSKKLLELEAAFDSERQEFQIQQLESEKALSEKQKEVDDNRRLFLIIGLITVIILSAIIINREVNRRRKSDALRQSESKLAETEKARLQEQLHFKNRELTSSALHIAQKNQLIQQVKEDLDQAQKQSESDHLQGIVNQLNFEKQLSNNWEQFMKTFKETDPEFFSKLKDRYPDLTKNELRLCSLLRMNLSSKDIASILSISDDGVKKARYRLRKKLAVSGETPLEEVMIAI
ncbi:MAG: tetratricopeptide repeat protein [Bacteroidota bacterium]